MKIQKYIILVVIMLLSLVACEPNHINDNLLESTVYFSRSGEVTATFYDAEGISDYSFYAVNAGFFEGQSKLSIKVDPSALEKYNEDNKTSFETLPEDYYTIIEGAGIIEGENRTCEFKIQFDNHKLKEFSEKEDYSDLMNYVIPFVLTAEGEIDLGSRPEGEGLNIVLIRPGMKRISASLVETNEINIPQTQIKGEFTYEVEIALSTINQWEVEVEVATGDKLIEYYNTNLTKRGSLEAYSALVPVPTDAYTIDFDNRVPKDSDVGRMKITFDATKVPQGVSSIVVTLDRATVDGEEIPIDGDAYVIINLVNIEPVSVSTTILSPSDRGKDSEFLAKYLGDFGYTILSRDGWTFSPESYHGTTYTNAIDGNTNSQWENRYGASGGGPTKVLPFNAILDLGVTQKFSALELWRRPHATYVTDLRGFEIYVSDDNVNWKYITTVDYGGTANAERMLYTFFNEVEARYVNLYITKANRAGVVSIAEIYLWNK